MSVIAVTGATGQQGRATAEALLRRQADVVALVRDETSAAARALAEAGAELRVVGDLADVDAVTAALRGVDAVFVMATMTGPDGVDGEVAMGIAAADAVESSDASFLVYSSVGGAERHSGVPHFESKRRVEQHIDTLGTPHAFLRPVYFMDNFAMNPPSIEDGTIVVRQPLAADIPLQMVAVADIGAVAAALLLDPAAAPGSIEIGGDEVTGDEVAQAFGERFRRPARYEALPLDVVEDDDLRAMFGWFAERPAYQADVAATRALDPQLWTFADWLRGQPDDFLDEAG